MIFLLYISCSVAWCSRGSDRRNGGRSPSADADALAPDSDRGGVCAEESSGEDHSRHSVSR